MADSGCRGDAPCADSARVQQLEQPAHVSRPKDRQQTLIPEEPSDYLARVWWLLVHYITPRGNVPPIVDPQRVCRLQLGVTVSESRADGRTS